MCCIAEGAGNMIDVHWHSSFGHRFLLGPGSLARFAGHKFTTCWRDMGLHVAMDYMTILLATCCRLQPSAAGEEGIEEGKDNVMNKIMKVTSLMGDANKGK